MRVRQGLAVLLFFSLFFGGLVIKQVQTRIGYEFHRIFVNLWEPLPGMEKYRIGIHEQASARWGSLVFISVDGRMIQRYRVGVRTGSAMEEIVRQSVKELGVYLWNQTMQDSNGRDQDLAGTGY